MKGHLASVLFSGVFVFLGATTQVRSAYAQASGDTAAIRVYSASEVDIHARPVENGTQPLYPDSLRPLGISGRVLAQFVVDTTGRVDTTSILTEAYGQPLFAMAVRQALTTMRFTVAQKGDHKVAEEIEQSFVFHKEEPAPINVDSVLGALARRGTQRRAEFAPGSPAPPYPLTMLRSGIWAVVNTEFVVDSTGHADPTTFRVTSVKTWRNGSAPFHDSTDRPDVDDVAPEQAFVQAVRTALPRMRFIPAQFNGRSVRQIVTQPFTFSILP